LDLASKSFLAAYTCFSAFFFKAFFSFSLIFFAYAGFVSVVVSDDFSLVVVVSEDFSLVVVVSEDFSLVVVALGSSLVVDVVSALLVEE
jgi:hypothetical protein